MELFDAFGFLLLNLITQPGSTPNTVVLHIVDHACSGPLLSEARPFVMGLDRADCMAISHIFFPIHSSTPLECVCLVQTAPKPQGSFRAYCAKPTTLFPAFHGAAATLSVVMQLPY